MEPTWIARRRLFVEALAKWEMAPWPGRGRFAAASCDCSCGVTVATRAGARLVSSPKNTTPTTATPMAPPSCWNVVSTPDAEPASLARDARQDDVEQWRDHSPEAEPADDEGRDESIGDFVSCEVMVPMIPRMPTTSSAEPIAIVYLPSRGATQVDIADATAEARLHGIVVKPALSALKPNPTWSIRLKVKKKAGMPAMKTAEMATPTLKDLMRNSESCTSGNLVAGSDRSYRTNASSANGLMAMQMNVQAGQPATWPWTSG